MKAYMKSIVNIIKKNKELWNLYSCKEEYDPSKTDRHGRFLYRFSENNNILKPKISQYLIKKGLRVQWPDNHKFAVCLTHDIDSIYPSWRYRYYTSLKLISNLKFKKSRQRFFKKENPFWNFKEISDLERKYNATSSFYIRVDEENYKISDLKQELKYLTDMGHEIGLHGSYNAFKDFDVILKEKKKLEGISGKKIIGYRNHFLRFIVPNTWELLQKGGFKYDTTFGYADMVGFRNCMCHPFKPYNLEKDKLIDIWEIPLSIMDGTLNQYMKLDVDNSWKYCKEIIDKVKKLNGVITVLWHNTFFDEVYRKDWSKLYEKLLIYSSEKGGWLTSGEKIYKYWERVMK